MYLRIISFLLISCILAAGVACNPDTHSLTISKTGTGSGRVKSNPAGIDCGMDCNHDYNKGTSVTLSAVAESYNSFDSWNGDNDCSDGIIVLYQNVSCTALFSYTCNPITQDCSDVKDGCYLSLWGGDTFCADSYTGASPGRQGDSCEFLNACDIGFGCLLGGTNGMVCARFCNTNDPGTTCQTIGDGFTCVQINQFYGGNTPDVPDDVGMCVDCSEYECP